MVDLFVFHNNFYKNLFSKGSSEFKKSESSWTAHLINEIFKKKQ